MPARLTAASLPRRYQQQVVEQLYGKPAPYPGEDWPAKHVPLPATAPLRQAHVGLNKTESAFLGHLKATYGPLQPVLAQSVTLKLANGVRYTPDFIVIQAPVFEPDVKTCLIAYEVKGFMRDDAAVKLKVAASAYPWIAFNLVVRKKGKWQITPVLP